MGVQVGDKVLYSPDHCHAFDRPKADSKYDVHGGLAFTFVHAEDTRGNAASGTHPGYPARKKGEPVDMLASCSTHDASGALTLQLPVKDKSGKLVTAQGHAIAPGRPVEYWPATVIAVNADGSADLEVEHPNGYVTLHYPGRAAHPDAPGIKYDPVNKGPHTFHLPGD